jgi:hypothetical protein
VSRCSLELLTILAREDDCIRAQLIFVNLSLAYSQQQGIGIIFIEKFFATCFGVRGGPTTIECHF